MSVPCSTNRPQADGYQLSALGLQIPRWLLPAMNTMYTASMALSPVLYLIPLYEYGHHIRRVGDPCRWALQNRRQPRCSLEGLSAFPSCQ